MIYVIIAALLIPFAYSLSKKYSDRPFFIRLRKKRGSVILFVTLTALISVQNFQALFIPFFVLLAIGFFYLITEEA